MESDYNSVLASGPASVSADTDIGMDGTVKHFVAHGKVRVCDSITDRYGNQTTLEYTDVTLPDGTIQPHVTKVTDPSLRELNFTWQNKSNNPSDPAWRITDVTGPGQSVHYDYYMSANETGAGGEAYTLKEVHLDPNGLNRTTTYTYASCAGETGLLASITDPQGNTMAYSYLKSEDMPRTIPPNWPQQNETQTVWVSSITEPAGVYIDPTGQTYSRPLVWRILASIPWGSDLPDYIVSVEDMNAVADGELLAAIIVEFDTLKRAKRICTGGPYNSYSLNDITYDDSNNVLTSTCRWEGRTFYHESEDENVTFQMERWDCYSYGRFGNVLTHWLRGYEDKKDIYTYWNEDKYFQKKTVKDMNGNVTWFDYRDRYNSNLGNRGNLLCMWDATKTSRDNVNRPTSDPSFSYTYNEHGQKTSETNANGVLTQYVYGDGATTDPWSGIDSKGNLIKVVQDSGVGHLNRTTWMAYDVAGRVTNRMDPMGRASTVSYNALGQPELASFPATTNPSTPAETVSYLYGANGRLSSVTQTRDGSTPITTSLSYENNCDRVSSVTDSVTGTISYTYYRRGNVAKKNLPNGSYFSYSYDNNWGYYSTFSTISNPSDLNSYQDALSQVKFHKDANDTDGRVVSNNCNDPGNYTEYNFSDDGSSYCYALYVYEGKWIDNYCMTLTNGHLKKIINKCVKSSPMGGTTEINLSENIYTYDNVGNRLSNTITVDTQQARTENYTYDDLYRLTDVNYGDSQTQHYDYDAMGNRTQKTDSVNGIDAYRYDNANRLIAVNSPSTDNYVNDANGNTTSGGGRTNTWDSQNRLASCVYNNGQTTKTSTFTYGADGLRRSMTVGNETTYYALEGSNVSQELQPDAQGVLQTKLTYLSGARGLEGRYDNVNDTYVWYVYDGLGSVLAEVSGFDGNGNVTITPTPKLDVFGGWRSAQAGVSKHRFCGSLGHTSEPDTGMIYMRARWMDPVTGRFVSEDSKRDGINWYVYCTNNPVNQIDPTGLIAGFDDYLNEEAEDGQVSIETGNSLINKINRIFNEVRQNTGMSRQQFREVVHELKSQMGMGAKEDLYLDPKTGDFF